MTNQPEGMERMQNTTEGIKIQLAGPSCSKAG